MATEGDVTNTGESDGGITDDTKSDAGLSEAERATPEPDTIVEAPVVEEPQPPSPAPEGRHKSKYFQNETADEV